ncbi:MAG TPA: sigma-70 family RNA polymerase sigma factor [Polyangia bacterium]|jgi:RNA polymerase sigma-70 factor|nr:sigma-70 family RNA polymerase sigma factor [Polyangia bacterium]
MQETSALTVIFLRYAPPHAQLATIALDGRFEDLLRHAWDTGRAKWPDIPLAQEAFIRHLAERLPPPGHLDPDLNAWQFLEQGCHCDLYLACACAQAVPAALLAFERHYLAQLPVMLAHLRQSPEAIDDVCQQLRTKFLVRTPEAPPKITDYSGRGSLISWIRVIATRAALYMLRSVKEAPEDPVATICEALPMSGADPEIELIKRSYRREFRQAVTDAFAALSDQDRNLLRLYAVDRLSTSEISLLFQVNQSTVSRWLTTARQRVYDETRTLLRRRLGLSSDEFESFIRVVNSQLDISLSQILGDDTGSLDEAEDPGSSTASLGGSEARPGLEARDSKGESAVPRVPPRRSSHRPRKKVVG